MKILEYSSLQESIIKRKFIEDDGVIRVIGVKWACLWGVYEGRREIARYKDKSKAIRFARVREA